MNDQTSTSTSTSRSSDEEWKQKILNQCRASIASSHDIVYNDECVYTFHSPFTSEKGILVNLGTFLATHEELLKYNNSSTATEDNYTAYVRITKHKMKGDIQKKKTSEEEKETEEHTTVTKLGIGIDGGFPSEKEIITSTYSVVVWNTKQSKIEFEIPYWDPTTDTTTSTTKNPILPDFIRQSVRSILHHVGTQLQQEVHTWELEEDPKPISQFCYTIPFVDNGLTISPNPKDWKCQKDPTVTDNLWLNLSTGYIGGGRKHWDGSGGSNGAIDHYIETGRKYPLVVKLGTITSDPSTADCYSYDPAEDGPVLIPNLSDLLARRGILVSSMYVVHNVCIYIYIYIYIYILYFTLINLFIFSLFFSICVVPSLIFIYLFFLQAKDGEVYCRT
jgi:ubiquitin carboxyl-terminal hydrolase 5/13